MAPSLLAHEKEITGIVDQALKEIFLQYFQMNIDLEKFRSGGLVDPLISQGTLLDKDELTVITLSIEREMLNILIKKVFPSSLDYEVMAHSCINEMTNIVSSRVKTFMNEMGFNFDLDIPCIVQDNEFREHDVEMRFVSQDNYLSVDLGRQGSGSSKNVA